MKTTTRSPTLPKEWSEKSANRRLCILYHKILSNKIGSKAMISWSKCATVMKRLLDTYSEIQVATLIIAHFNYHPERPPISAWLVENLPRRMWDVSLLQNSANIYIAYLLYDREVNFNDIDELKNRVYGYVDSLTDY